MNRNELADRAEGLIFSNSPTIGGPLRCIDDTIYASRRRFLGVGAQQYEDPDGTQRFEREPITDLLVGLGEEVVDTINYCVMLLIRERELDDAAIDEIAGIIYELVPIHGRLLFHIERTSQNTGQPIKEDY